MAVGDVFFFSSNKAVGFDERDKYHVYLGKTDHFRAPDEYVFMYISSANYADCFPISFSDYGDFLKYDSFVTCSDLVFYSMEELKARGPKKVGQLTKDHMAKLHAHLAGHEVMVTWQINIACDALKVAL